MTLDSLPDKSLYTVNEACEHLSVSRATLYRLVNSGLLEVRRPMPRTTRITRDSIVAHLERGKDPEAIRRALAEADNRKVAQAQHAQVVQAQQQEAKKEGLLSRWGLSIGRR